MDEQEGQTTTHLPVLIEAWRTALSSGTADAIQEQLPPKFLAFLQEHDDAKRRGMIQEIYAFLHAQQLVMMSGQLNTLLSDVRKLNELAAPKQSPRNWLCVTAAACLGAVGTFVFLRFARSQ